MGEKRGEGEVLGLDWNTYSRGMKAFLALEVFVAVAALLSDMMLMVSIPIAGGGEGWVMGECLLRWWVVQSH